MVLRKTYFPLGLPAAESQEIFDAALTYVQPLMVSRSGTVLVQVEPDRIIDEGQLFYIYNPSLGKLIFGYPFNEGEDIEIVYKTI